MRDSEEVSYLTLSQVQGVHLSKIRLWSEQTRSDAFKSLKPKGLVKIDLRDGGQDSPQTLESNKLDNRVCNRMQVSRLPVQML